MMTIDEIKNEVLENMKDFIGYKRYLPTKIAGLTISLQRRLMPQPSIYL